MITQEHWDKIIDMFIAVVPFFIGWLLGRISSKEREVRIEKDYVDTGTPIKIDYPKPIHSRSETK